MRTALVGIPVLAVALSPAPGLAQPVQAVSRSSQPSETGGSHSSLGTAFVVSADGRYVVFESRAGNLVQGEVLPPYTYAVFVRDRVSGTTSLVSHTSSSMVAAGNGSSRGGVISEDGAYVAFTSQATDLVPGTDAQDNAYLYDRTSGQVTLVSHALGLPGADGNGASRVQALSADGRYVVFLSFAGDLVGSALAGAEQVYVFDRVTGLNALVSHVPASPTTGGSGDCTAAVISADGAFIAFSSAATDLVPGSDLNGGSDVFLFERTSGTVSLVSHAFGQPTDAATGQSKGPSISDDGGVVTFSSDAYDLLATPDAGGRSDVFAFDRLGGTLLLVSHASGSPQQPANEDSPGAAVSGDGHRVAFMSEATDIVPGTDLNDRVDVFLFDIPGGVMRLVSHVPGSTGATGSDASGSGPLNGDGSLLAFASSAQDLVAGFDPNGSDVNVFVYSWTTGNVVLASHAMGSAVVAGNGASTSLGVAKGVGLIAFASHASDMVPGDANLSKDVFGFAPSTGQVEVMSKRAPGMPDLTGNRPSQTAGNSLPKLSDDGRYVVFQSDAANLVPGLVNPSGQPFRGIYLFDAAAGTTSLVSHAPGSPLTPGCLGQPSDAVVSGDGGHVAFNCSVASSPSGPPIRQVYLYDRTTQQLTLASHGFAGPLVLGDSASGFATLSRDGSRVAFVSQATNLTNGSYFPFSLNVFVYDRGTGVVTLVSRAAGQPEQPADAYSYAPAVSGDGSRVAYASDASNLVVGVSNPGFLRNLYLFDVAAGTSVLVSHAAGLPGTPTDGNPYASSVSDDGRFVAFQSAAVDLVVGQVDGNPYWDVFVYDANDGSIALASHLPALPTTAGGGREAWLSADGGTSVFSCSENLVGGTPSGYSNICSFDRVTGEVKLVSHAFSSQTVGSEFGGSWPSVSGDGATVAFYSDSTDLLDHPISTLGGNIYAYEPASGTVRLVSHLLASPGGAAGLAANLTLPGTSRNGKYVTFESTAPGIVPGDFNAAADVFLFGPIGPASADLGVTKSDGQTTAVAGEYLTYTVAVTNSGPGAVSGAVVSDALPVQLPGASWQCFGSGGAACQQSQGLGDLQVPADVPIGSTLWLSISGYLDPAAAPGTLTNTASVALPAGYSDPDPSNNSATDTDTLIVQADLGTTQTDAPDPVRVGQDVTYSVAARNHGPSQAAGGTLTDVLPASTTLVSTVPGPPACTVAGSTVTCTFGTLAPDAAATLDVTVQTSTAGAVTNVAAVAGTTADPVSSNDVSLESSLVVNRPPGELIHGSMAVRDLDPATSPTTGPDFYRLRQEPVSSYQVIVDAATGDIGSGAGPALDRVGDDGATVIQSSVPAGAGGSRSLAWQNAQTVVVDEEYVRVGSAGCAPCGPEDTYRIRAWETTLDGPRFNNSASQATVLVLENATAASVAGNVWFRRGDGQLLQLESFLIASRGTFVLNTASIVPDVAGSVTVTHNGPYGGLAGKLVSVEPATGFTFDTPLRERPR